MVKALSLIKSALLRARSFLAALGSAYGPSHLRIHAILPAEESKMTAPMVSKKSTHAAT